MIELNVYEYETGEYHFDTDTNTIPCEGDVLDDGEVIVQVKRLKDDHRYRVWIQY